MRERRDRIPAGTVERGEPTGDGHAEHNVHHKPHLALHRLLREPAGDAADDDGCDPADLLLFHLAFTPSVNNNHNVMLDRCPAHFDGLSRPLNEFLEKRRDANLSLEQLDYFSKVRTELPKS